MDPKTLTPEELARLTAKRWVRAADLLPFIGAPKRTFYWWCETGKIPASKRGHDRAWWVDMTALREALGMGFYEFLSPPEPDEATSPSDPVLLAFSGHEIE